MTILCILITVIFLFSFRMPETAPQLSAAAAAEMFMDYNMHIMKTAEPENAR